MVRVRFRLVGDDLHAVVHKEVSKWLRLAVLWFRVVSKETMEARAYYEGCYLVTSQGFPTFILY